jgi:hypothetical protein
MEEDLSIKRKKPDETSKKSRFFAHKPPSTESAGSGGDPSQHAGPSRLHDPIKENVPPLEQDADLDVDFQISDNEQEDDFDLEPDFVEQEDGYISPPPSWDDDDDDDGSSSDNMSPDLSSPVRTRKVEDDDDFGVDPISSPPTTKRCRDGRVLVCDTPTPTPDPLADLARTRSKQQSVRGVDLRHAFGDELTSEIDCFDDDGGGHVEDDTPSRAPSPQAPMEADVEIEIDLEMDDIDDTAARTEIVATGWWAKYAMDGRSVTVRIRRMSQAVVLMTETLQRHATLKRRDTTVTPTGRHSATAVHPSAARRSDPRKNVLFAHLEDKDAPDVRPSNRSNLTPELGANPSSSVVASDAEARFAKFR